jgi:hypothetical protein
MEGFPDVELAVMEILSPLGNTGTGTDEDFDIPIRVNRTGGPVRPWEDNATVEVTCFCRTRPESAELNKQVVATLNDLRGVQTTAGLIDKISNFVAPFQVPDLNPDIRKVPSTWTVTSRLQELPTQP